MSKKSFPSEYSSRITPQKVSSLLGAWHDQLGEDPIVQSHIFQSEAGAGLAFSPSSPRMPTVWCFSMMHYRDDNQ
jgi:hypothetical protein